MTEPFWEAAYRELAAPSAFGSPSEEIETLVPKLPAAAKVLDLGCGDGRNALFLLAHGFHVTAVDASSAAVAKLVVKGQSFGDRLRARVGDARHYSVPGPFDLVVAHGLLHLMPRPDWSRLLKEMRQQTAPLGYNVVAVFTDALAAPPDLAPFMLGLFREGELFHEYQDWRIDLRRSYVLDDEHPGGVRHRHPINKIVAQKPLGDAACGPTRS